MDATAYPDPTSSQMDTNNSGLYLSGRPDSRQSQHTAEQVQALAASEQMEIPSPHELDPVQQHNFAQSMQPQMEMRSPHELDPVQQHNFAQATPPQSLAQQAMDLNNHPANAYITPSHDGISRDQRKRSKVSRACDECRRKKIRCDAAGAEEVSSCSSCRKSNRVCSYSRQPQKRGPSKGYIKELADRVKVLESLSDVTRSPPVQRDGSAPAYTGLEALQGLPTSLGRSMGAGTKRSYSMISSTSHGGGHTGAFDGDVTVYFNENTEQYREHLNPFYQHVHTFLPLLPASLDELLARLSATRCSLLPSALFRAIECVMSILGPHHSQEPIRVLDSTAREAIQKAELELCAVHSNNASDPIELSDEILYIAALLLNVVCLDMRPLPYCSTQMKVDYLGRCIKRLSLLKNRVRRDGEATQAFYTRVSGVALIYDRIIAMGTFTDSSFPVDSTELLNQFSSVVDERFSELARVADVVDQLRNIFKARIANPVNPSPPNFLAGITPLQSIVQLIKHYLSNFRNTANRLQDSMLHSAIFYAELLLARMNPVATGVDLLSRTEDLINSLEGCNPLTHHFATLATTSLIDLVRNSDVDREEASRVIDQFVNALTSGRVFRVDDSNGPQWINNLFGALAAATDHLSQANNDVSGLRNLAEAAVTEREAGEASADTRDEITAEQMDAQINAEYESLQRHNSIRVVQEGYANAFV